MAKNKPWGYVEDLYSSIGIEGRKGNETSQPLGSLAQAMAAMHIRLSELLPIACKEGTAYAEAVDFCVSGGATLSQAKEIASAYFALNNNINPSDPKGLEQEAQLVQLQDLLSDALSFWRMAREAKDEPVEGQARITDLSDRDAMCVLILRCVHEDTDDEQGGPEVESISLKRPDSFVFGGSKIFHRLGDIASKGSGMVKTMTDKDTSKDVLVGVRLSYQGDGLTIQGKYELTGFDKEVHNTVTSLYAAGNTTFTAADVFRVMNGGKVRGVKKEQTDRIARSIDKMMFTRITIDLQDELKSRKLTINDSRIVGGYVETQLLHAAVATFKAENGKTVKAFNVKDEPILYTYNKAVRQLVTVPIGHLDTSGAISNTDQVIAIRGYLLYQIKQLKTKHRDNPRFLYETICKESRVDYPEKKDDRKRLRNQVKALLSVWENQGLIKGFEDYKEGRSVVGVRVDI